MTLQLSNISIRPKTRFKLAMICYATKIHICGHRSLPGATCLWSLGIATSSISKDELSASDPSLAMTSHSNWQYTQTKHSSRNWLARSSYFRIFLPSLASTILSGSNSTVCQNVVAAIVAINCVHAIAGELHLMGQVATPQRLGTGCFPHDKDGK